MFKHEGNRTFCAEVAAIFTQDVADISYRTGAVICCGINDQSRAAHAVTFVAGFFKFHAFQLAGALQDGVFNGVLGHIAGTGL